MARNKHTSGATSAEHAGTHAGTHADGGARYGNDRARDKFGGLNIGAVFFGWLVAIAVTILLTSIVGAITAALGSNAVITQTEAQREAGTIGLVAAVVLVAVLAIGYYAGGYVAGRMSRFDGGRQGIGVWILGLAVTIIAIVLGAVFGSQYNILDRVDLPRLPISAAQLGWGGIITAIAVLLVSALAAFLGGKIGHRYHDRVDRLAGR
ncbi:hypothetical protein G6553_20515 [Nocardioides sp. IC4_145]|uniref:hypothetical protein n=1 Tax=Nocardioides sp. IC4_145 TaxID=2714037 RepID=UPI00140A95B8|nr:hypothetical protein [Nocardioides sp. IC4_145]NHC25549.1 hypothetical protein [Nocardioides sp. IC4_145]